MKLSCHIIQDLLPSYKKDTISGKTREDISLHLEECEECRKLYHMPCRESKSQQSGERKFYISRELIGLAVILFVCLRFVLAYQGISQLWQYEAEVDILLVSGVAWFFCKDLIAVKQKPDKILAVLHIVVFAVSIAFGAVLYRVLAMAGMQGDYPSWYMEDKIGITLFWALHAGIICVVSAAAYGLYASALKSKNYGSLVSHGVGSAVMLYFILAIITGLDLRMIDARIISEMLKSAVFPYVEGLALTLIYFVYGSWVSRAKIVS